MRKFLVNYLVFLIVGMFTPTILASEDIDAKEQKLISEVLSAQKQYGENSLEHLDALSNLGKWYEKNPDYRQKLKNTLADFISRYELKFGDNPRELDNTKLGLSELYLSDHEFLKAIPLLQQMRFAYQFDAAQQAQTSDKAEMIYSPTLCAVEVNLINAYLQAKQLADAENEITIFFEYIQNRDDATSPHKNNHLIAEVYSSWAEVKVQQNKLDQALEYQAKSLAIFEQDSKLPGYKYAETNARYEKLKKQLDTGAAETNVSRSFTHSIKIYEDYQFMRDKGEIDAAIKILEDYKAELEKNDPQSYFELGYCYLELAVDYNQKNEDLIRETKNQYMNESNGQTKWLDLAISSAQSSVIAFQQVPNAEPYVSMGLSILGLIKFVNQVGDIDEINSILHASIKYATQRGPENILVAGSQSLLSVNYAAKNQPDLSIFWGKQAINTLQSLKENEDELDVNFRAVFQLCTHMVYEIVPTVMFYQGRSAEAQQVLQMLKERELYESLRDENDDPRKMRLKYTKGEQDVLDKYNNYLKQLNVDKPPLKNYEQFSLSIIKKLSEIDALIKITPSKAIQNNTSVIAETTALQKAINSLSTSEPEARAIGVQYLLTKDKLLIVLNLPSKAPIFKDVPITATNLYRNIVQVTMQVQESKAEAKYYAPALKELYSVLIQPILPELQKLKAKTLMLSLDSKLRLLPFAALMDSDGHYLLENYTIALFNEAANQSMEKLSNSKWQIAAMGLSNQVGGFRALTAVPDELHGILNTKGIEGDEYLNNQFTKEQLIKVTNQFTGKPYNVLHIASHFELQPSDPSESALYMGDGTKFSLKEMSSLPLNFKHFELVTYSACQTAVGGDNDNSGKEIESLSAQTQRQGAQAVMATLWKVSDQSTAKLMQDYYSQRNQGLNKAEALRAVQLNMALGMAGKDNWKSPHHWAGFVISGNWR